MRLSLLKKKDFSIFISGKFVSVIGSNVQQFALSLYVYAITGSATIFAAMLSISILPRIILSPFAGVFGDWFDRKKMIVRLDIINGIILLLFAAIFIGTGGLSVALIFALVILLEITEVFYGAASSAIVPSIVEKEELPQAMSFVSLVISLGSLLSPILGAALYGLLGLLIVLIINGISFFITGLLEMLIRVPANHKRPEKIDSKAFLKDFKEGLVVVKENKFIKTMISIAMVLNFVFSPIISVGLLVLIIDILEASEFQYGLFQSVIMFAMIIGPIIAARLLKKNDIAKVCFNGLFASVIILLLVALLFNDYLFSQFTMLEIPFIILLVLCFFLGLFISVVNVSISTLFAQTVPLHLMGRASTVMSLLVTVAIPLGQVIFGVLFDTVPAFYAITAGSMIVFITLMIYRKPLLRSTVSKSKDKLKGELSYEV